MSTFSPWHELTWAKWITTVVVFFIVKDIASQFYRFLVFETFGDKWVALFLDPHLRRRCTKSKKGLVTGTINRHGLAWTKWTSTIVVCHKRGQSPTVLPVSYFIYVSSWSTLCVLISSMAPPVPPRVHCVNRVGMDESWSTYEEHNVLLRWIADDDVLFHPSPIWWACLCNEAKDTGASLRA